MSDQSSVGDESQLEAEFAELLRGIWRAVTHVTRSMEHLPTLPAQQIDVLQRLAGAGGLTPAQLADGLRLSRPTISELVRRMETDGLIERVRSTSDGRSVVLRPSEAGQKLLKAFDHGVQQAVSSGLNRLPGREKRRLLGDVEIFAHLREQLTTIADAADAQSRQ